MDALRPFVGTVNELITVYESGERREQGWFKSPVRPGIQEGGPHQDGQPALRDGDTLSLAMWEWIDSNPAGHGHYGAVHGSVDTSTFRLYQDGELIAEAARPRGQYQLSPDPAEYRLEVDVVRNAPWWTTSTKTRTVWTLEWQRPSGDAPELVPLLLVDYDLQVDLLNTELRPRDRQGPPRIEILVRRQAGAAEAPVAGARLWTSNDDGQTWRPRAARNLGGGRFQFPLDSRDPEQPEFISLRVEAWDADGNRIEQEITRAWQRLPR